MSCPAALANPAHYLPPHIIITPSGTPEPHPKLAVIPYAHAAHRFNIQISSAKFSFARQTIALPSGTVIPQGLKLSANMTFLSIFVNFDVSVDTTGFELQLEVRDVLVSAYLLREVPISRQAGRRSWDCGRRAVLIC